MPALTPQFLMDLESRMSIITENEYARLTKNVWWQKIAKLRNSTGRRELVTWLLATAQIHDQGSGGNIRFDDLVSTFTEYEHKHAGAGLRLTKDQLEDTDGGGLQLAAQWSSDIGAQAAYWPQKEASRLLKNGHTASEFSSYDQVAFFATNHPLNPFRPSAGTFKNLLTGGDAAPIDTGVTLDVALANMSKVFAHIAGIKMPNGEDPRFLRPAFVLCPPKLFPRAVQLSDAKFIAQAAATGGGSADVEALINALGYAQPVMADELAGFESDTTYFVAAEQAATSELGAVIYGQREAFNIGYYGPMTDAQLSRMRELEWQMHGRNVIAPGHPYLLFKVKAS